MCVARCRWGTGFNYTRVCSRSFTVSVDAKAVCTPVVNQPPGESILRESKARTVVSLVKKTVRRDGTMHETTSRLRAEGRRARWSSREICQTVFVRVYTYYAHDVRVIETSRTTTAVSPLLAGQSQ